MLKDVVSLLSIMKVCEALEKKTIMLGSLGKSEKVLVHLVQRVSLLNLCWQLIKTLEIPGQMRWIPQSLWQKMNVEGAEGEVVLANVSDGEMSPSFPVYDTLP